MRKILKSKRKEANFTQKSFAEALGISKRTYENIEQGKSFPRESTMRLISKVLNYNSLDLFDNEIPKLKRGDVSKNICEYMKVKSSKYTIYYVNAIRSGLSQELKDRKKNNIHINSHSIQGKKEINKRVAKIASNNFKLDITAEDVKLCKECIKKEFTDRTGKCTWSIPEVRKRLGHNPVTGY